MEVVAKNITIRAPAQKIFAYLAEPHNYLTIWPGMLEIDDVRRMSSGERRFRWVRKMFGARFEGTSENLDYEPPKRIVSKTHGGIDSVISWAMEPHDGETLVALMFEYQIPTPLHHHPAEDIMAQTERDIEAILAGLKAAVEEPVAV